MNIRKQGANVKITFSPSKMVRLVSWRELAKVSYAAKKRINIASTSAFNGVFYLYFSAALLCFVKCWTETPNPTSSLLEELVAGRWKPFSLLLRSGSVSPAETCFSVSQTKKSHSHSKNYQPSSWHCGNKRYKIFRSRKWRHRPYPARLSACNVLGIWRDSYLCARVLPTVERARSHEHMLKAT